MYKDNPDLFSVYECGHTKIPGSLVVVKAVSSKGYYVHEDGATVYLHGGGHFNCYHLSKGNSMASEFQVGDTLEVIGHEPDEPLPHIWSAQNAILRKASSSSHHVPIKGASLTDFLLA